MNMFLLRNMSSNMHSPTPSDKYMIFTTALLDNAGQAVLDLSEYKISPYAKLYYTILGTTGALELTGLTATFGTNSIPITSWQVPISLTKVDPVEAVPPDPNATPPIAGSPAIPGVTAPLAGNEVGVLIIVDPRELNG